MATRRPPLICSRQNWQISAKECVCVHARAQSCPALCDLLDYSPPGSSVHGIFQARILEWVAISFSRGSSWSRDRTWVSCISGISRQILYHCSSWEVLSYKVPDDKHLKVCSYTLLWLQKPLQAIIHVCVMSWLCSNKALFTDADMWTYCDFPGSGNIILLLIFFDHLKITKTVLSSQAVQKVAGRTAFSCGLQLAIPSLGAECADTWIMSDRTHSFTGSPPPHRKARSVAQKQCYGWSVTGRLKLEGKKLGKASELSGCDSQSQGPTTRPQSQREEPSLLPKWKSEKPWAILTGKGPRVQMFSPSSRETLATHHMSGVTTEEQGAETPQGRVTYPGSFGSTLRCSSPAPLPCITVLELSPCRANPVCHQQTASVLARAKCRVQHGKGAPWTWTDYSMEMKPVSFQKTVLPIEGLSPRKGLDFYILKSLLPSPGLICILYLNTKISHNKTASSIQAFSR